MVWPTLGSRTAKEQNRPGDANSCAKDGFQVLRSPQAATFNRSVIQCKRLRYRLLSSRWYCRELEAGLRKCRLGRSSCLPVPASSVGDKRLVYGLRHSGHVSDAFISLHWLRAQERVRYKTAVLMYKVTHGTAPSYLSQLVRVADLPGRRSLRSARANCLLVPSVKLSTVGGRAFPVAGPTIWNNLPDNVISAPSLSTFRQRLQTFLFQASFPDIIIDPW